MARIPTYDFNGTIGTGTIGPTQVDTSIGQSVERLGAQVGAAGVQYAHYQARLDATAQAEADKRDNLQDELTFQGALTTANQTFQDFKEKANPTGKDFTKDYLSEFDKQAQEVLGNVRPDNAAAWQVRLAKIRTHYAQQASAYEHSLRESTVAQAFKSQTDLLSTMIQAGGDVNLANEQADAAVKNLGRTYGPEKQALIRNQMGLSIEAALIERNMKSDPIGTEKMLRDRIAGGVRSTGKDPVTDLAIDAAARWNVNPQIMLAIRYAETGNKAPTKASKSIDGHWQMGDGEWKEVGMVKSKDPAIEAEAAARLFAMRSKNLSANGLEPNMVNMWGAHWLGPGGWRAAQKVDPSMSMREFYKPFMDRQRQDIDEVMKSNGWKANTTVGDVINTVNTRSAKAMSETSKLVGPSSGPSPEPMQIGDYTFKHLTNDNLPALYGRVKAEADKVMDATMNEAAKRKVADGLHNSYDRDDRQTLNKASSESRLGDAIVSGDPNAIGDAMARARSIRQISSSEAAGASALINSPDPTMRVKGYEIARAVHDADPLRGLEHSGFEGEVKQRAEAYAKNLAVAGNDPAETIRRVDRMFSQEFKQTTVEQKETIKAERARASFSDLTNMPPIKNGGVPMLDGVFSRWFGDGKDRTPQTEKLKDYLLETYRDQYEWHLKDQGGPKDTKGAKAAALYDMQRMFGVSKMFGRDEFTMYPVDQIMPALPNGDKSYLEVQALRVAQSKAAADKKGGFDYGEVDPKKVYIVPTAETVHNIRSGQPPAYDIAFMSKNGLVMAGQWRPDYQAGMQEATTSGSASATSTPKPASGGRLQDLRNKPPAASLAADDYGYR